MQEVLEVNIKPGWKPGTRLTFEGKGDEVRPGGWRAAACCACEAG
jgi:hypothetical protein